MGLREWSIGVFGIVTDDEGKILISRRGDGRGWDIPGGGFEKEKDSDFVSRTVVFHILSRTTVTTKISIACDSRVSRSVN